MDYQDDPASDGSQEAWVFRLGKEREEVEGQALNLVGAPDGRGVGKRSSSASWNPHACFRCQADHWVLWFRMLVSTFVDVCSFQNTQTRALKSIWSSFAKGEAYPPIPEAPKSGI